MTDEPGRELETPKRGRPKGSRDLQPRARRQRPQAQGMSLEVWELGLKFFKRHMTTKALDEMDSKERLQLIDRAQKWIATFPNSTQEETSKELQEMMELAGVTDISEAKR